MAGSSTNAIPKTITKMHKIRLSKKWGYKGKTKSAKHRRINSNLPEKLEIAC
jgi:hypothetical protein